MAWTWVLRADTGEHAAALQLTKTEMVLLAWFEFEQDQHGPRTIYDMIGTGRVFDLDPRRHEAYQSLCRFGYIVAGEPRKVRQGAVEDVLSGSARARLAGMRARTYKCCSYAIALPCVCAESTYCPNPEHVGANGCHGTHD